MVMKAEIFGTWWNSRDIDLIKTETGEIFALHGWNGETYLESFKVTGKHLLDASEETYEITPVYEFLDYNEDTEEYETINIISYEIAKRSN